MLCSSDFSHRQTNKYYFIALQRLQPVLQLEEEGRRFTIHLQKAKENKWQLQLVFVFTNKVKVKGQKTREPVKKAPVVAENEYELPNIVHLSLPATLGELVCWLFGFFSTTSTSAVRGPKTICANWSWSDLEGRATSDQFSLLLRVLFDLCPCCLLLNRNILRASSKESV